MDEGSPQGHAFKRLAEMLGAKFLAETCAIASLISAILAIRIYPQIAYVGVVLSIMAFIPLLAFGRQRYCLTGLFIFIFSSIGFIASTIGLVALR